MIKLVDILKEISENQNIVDKILDKISTQGKDSLTPEEKEYLDRYSKGEKNIPEPTTMQDEPISTSSVKAEIYPWYNSKFASPKDTKQHQKYIQLYDNIAGEFLKPLVNVIAQQLEISPKDIRTSFDGLYNKNSPFLSIQIKLPNDIWENPWTGNSLIMQTKSKGGIVINNLTGIKADYDKQPGATLPEVEELYDDLYMMVKKRKILDLVNIRLSQFMAGFRDQKNIAPNTPIIYTGK